MGGGIIKAGVKEEYHQLAKRSELLLGELSLKIRGGNEHGLI